jgi:general secretion pathway protein K
LYQHFTDTFSLYDFDSPNLNGNRLEPLLAQEAIDTHQQLRITEYLSGAGSYPSQGPGFFKNARSVAAVAGGQLEKLGYGFKVNALRITVTVRQGVSSFQLSVVVAPEGGAKVVAASSGAGTASSSGASKTKPESSAKAKASASTTDKSTDLKYPFTFLEIRENDSVVPPLTSTAEPTA